MSKFRTTAVAVAASASLAVAAAAAAAATPAPAHRGDAGPNVVVEWNQALLALAQTPRAVPATVHPTREFAIMSAAVFDAVDAIDRDGPQYRTHLVAPRSASTRAAAATAAHDVLRALFPAFASSLDERLAADLAAEPSGWARDAGARVGAQAAAALLALRADDGSDATPPTYTTTGQPGDFLPPAVFTHWAAVTPFLLSRADRFRPPPPPALTSRAYAEALDQVRRLGQNTSTERTTEQTTIGQFWAAPIQNYWNAIAEQVVVAEHSDLDRSARVFALLDLGLADTTIALYDAKYTYRLWRPITAIRLADTDGNPRTAGDPTWTPLATTPADPSYPGAHSALSATAAAVLAAAYGDRTSFSVTSPLTPGVTRSFDRFSDAVTEAGQSRIYAGIHTILDHRAGVTLGTLVGANTLIHLLTGH